MNKTLDKFLGDVIKHDHVEVAQNSVKTDSVYSTVESNSAYWGGSGSIGEYIPLSGSSNIYGSLIPSVSGLTLGTSAKMWSDIFVSTGSLYIGNCKLNTNASGDLLVNGNSVAYYSEVTAIITANVGGFLTQTEFNTYSGIIFEDQHSQDLVISGKLLRSDFESYSGGLSATVALKSHTHSATAIVSDNLDVARMPVSGTWELAASLDITNGVKSILHVNTVSGFVGIGTSNPAVTLHISGTDNTSPFENYDQKNAIVIDGNADTDKNFTISELGERQWSFQTYRDEKARFLYFYNNNSGKEPFIISANGRIGVNQSSNIMNYHTQYLSEIGGNLDDMEVVGTYDVNIPYNTTYQIYISSIGTTDNFHWRKSYDSSLNWTSWSDEIPCSTSATLLEYGVSIIFGNITGHNINDGWEFTAFSQNPQSTFSVKGIMFQEFGTTTDYTQAIPAYTDLTYLASTTYGNSFEFIPIGTGASNKGACYFGNTVKFNMIFIPVVTPPTGMSIVYEYFNGTSTWNDNSSWTEITGINNFVDDTLGLTRIGYVSWNSGSMTDWVKGVFPEEDPALYELFWIRARSTTTMTIAPIVDAVMPHGQYRFSVYCGYLDTTPAFYVKSGGRTFIHVPDGRGTTFNIENASLSGNLMRFSVEQANNVRISMRQGTDDTSHETIYQYGGIAFNNTDVDSTFTNKFNKAFKFYKDTDVTSELVLSLNTDGSISTGVSAYETLIVDDNDIPNKKYVDSLIGGMQLQGNWNADTNTPDITGITQVGYAWAVSVSGNTDLGGITDWQIGQMAVKNFAGWTKINAIPAVWGTMVGTLSGQTDLWLQLEDKFSKAEGTVWSGNNYISNVGTITGGTWQGTRINSSYLDVNLTTQGNTFNGANQLLKLNGIGGIPAINGSLLTNIPAFGIIEDSTNRFITDAQLSSFSGRVTTNDFNVSQHTQDLAITGKVSIATYITGQHTQDLAITGKQVAGNYIIGLSGDVSATGPGIVASTIAAQAVTYAKFQNVTGPILIGRHTTDTGIAQSISGAMVKTMLSLNNVENTTLSTWSGTVNVHTIGSLSGMTVGLVSKTNTYPITLTDVVILCDTTSTAFTVTLPTAIGISGKVYTIKRISAGTNRLTIATTSSQTIDGITTALLDGQYNSITVISDGANWNII